ncbi:hypothetical protein [Tardiphaga sp.]|uniref:hypothetical protein n=1 Tax=Tardiphaga sp. TaxID=1926292 RepID=UPI002613534D|nr:hypothetical protein [Tardiphaga sp.]MDB5617820.1 hypothetical protein [Tardiphaga sp.]
MSHHEKEILKDCLFSDPGKRLINIKFMRGTAKTIDPEAFSAELCSIVAQRDNGLEACGPAKTGRAPIDLRKRLSGM